MFFLNVVQIFRLRRELRRAADYFTESPVFQLAQRAALDDAHYIAQLGRSLFIVRIELLALTDDPLVLEMWYPAADFHHDGFIHLGRIHLADFLVLLARRFQLGF